MPQKPQKEVFDEFLHRASQPQRPASSGTLASQSRDLNTSKKTHSGKIKKELRLGATA